MSVAREISSRIEERPMLAHPFYQAWTAGTLPQEALRAYACQYFKHVAAFPRYVSAVHSGCDDLEVRKALLQNLVEEEQGDDDHPTLWLRFAGALGADRREVESTEAWPETRALVDTFFALCKDADYRVGLAALLAYESQIPAVARAKIDGLARFYGIDDPAAVRFFDVHLEADVAHAATERALLDARAPADPAPLFGAAERARDALWSFLDAAARHAGVGCARA